MIHPTTTHETPEDLLGPVAAITTNWIPDLPLDDIDYFSTLPAFLQFDSDSPISPPAPMMMYPDASMSWISWLEGSKDGGNNDTFLSDRVAPCTVFESQSSGSVQAVGGVLMHNFSPATLEMEPLKSDCEIRQRKDHKRQVSSDTQDSFDLAAAAEKRRRNTETARRGRARKNALIASLENSVRELEAEKLVLVTRVAVLQCEADTFREKDEQLTRRVVVLEERLVEMLRALLEQA
ncbi:hypothetical protein HDU98_004463 [Podochytrium sp. JEL0797]|nr:hypothetical protein HDU98_004463 [Podochytrium sp. JEL0797]